MSFSRVPFGFWWMLLLLCGVAFLCVLLFWTFRFDLGVSPSWQVQVHHLMLLLLFLAAMGLAAPNGFSRMGRFDWVMAVLLPVVLTIVLVAGWLHAGPYVGYRDPRLFSLTLVSVALFFRSSTCSPLASPFLSARSWTMFTLGLSVGGSVHPSPVPFTRANIPVTMVERARGLMC